MVSAQDASLAASRLIQCSRADGVDAEFVGRAAGVQRPLFVSAAVEVLDRRWLRSVLKRSAIPQHRKSAPDRTRPSGRRPSPEIGEKLFFGNYGEGTQSLGLSQCPRFSVVRIAPLGVGRGSRRFEQFFRHFLPQQRVVWGQLCQGSSECTNIVGTNFPLNMLVKFSI
ncbi:hypothetical protein Rmet_2833 [Cupriavidus metallidurans CH34]|uniref:Uncharacterized protein n=1 Tax=Cupriavidus metallidurans (strain ATCC 43123 / DSM 2839 / NBRC 102507 / CH34) TaxID=266264 RepID=Q1LJH0_CUPMC|nr:hypothetical protein Rmet_2833 [Cupriavidus metallidurans CH34]